MTVNPFGILLALYFLGYATTIYLNFKRQKYVMQAVNDRVDDVILEVTAKTWGMDNIVAVASLIAIVTWPYSIWDHFPGGKVYKKMMADK